MTPKHFLSLADIPATALRSILDEAKSLKRARRGFPKGRQDLDAPFAGETLAMLFEKSSTRTRFSFDMGMRQLGGSSITTSSGDLQIGRGETIADTARVLSRFVDAIMIRAKEHSTVVEMAEHATIPVINGLTNYNHPCQIMADLQTLEEHRGDLSDMTLSWIGDGNNVAVSFVNAAAAFGYRLQIASPAGYEVDAQSVARAREAGAQIEELSDAAQAARGADVLIADTWVSMGDLDADQRFKDLASFQVTDALMELAAPSAVFLHCLPAHRGEEVVASVIDGPRSIVFDEAENRLHAQKAILRWCMDA